MLIPHQQHLPASLRSGMRHPTTFALCFSLGDKKAAEAIFAKAKHVIDETFRISRVIANPMETRAAIGSYDPGQDRYTLFGSLQAPHIIRDELARSILHVPASRLRVVSPDVGGAFGLKAGAFPELGLVLWTAKRTERPIKWVCERSEAFIADHHARDNVSRVRLALDDHGKFLALGVKTTANVGAYIDSFGLHCPTNNLGGLAGPYAIGHYSVDVTGVFTNTHATCAYRGAGRPEASYCVERIVTIAAQELGISSIELRRRNMIPPEAMPFNTGLVYTYDFGGLRTDDGPNPRVGRLVRRALRAERRRKARETPRRRHCLCCRDCRRATRRSFAGDGRNPLRLRRRRARSFRHSFTRPGT